MGVCACCARANTARGSEKQRARLGSLEMSGSPGCVFPHPRRVFVRVAHAQILRAAPKNNAPGMGIQAVEVEKTLRWKAKKELIHIISRTTKHFAMAARDQRKAAQKHDEFRIRLLFYPSAVAPLA